MPGGTDRPWRLIARQNLEFDADPLAMRLAGMEERLREAILRHTAAEAARTAASQARADAEAAKARANAAQAETDAFRTQAIAAAAQLEALRASTSWRITAPLRGLRTILRRR